MSVRIGHWLSLRLSHHGKMQFELAVMLQTTWMYSGYVEYSTVVSVILISRMLTVVVRIAR